MQKGKRARELPDDVTVSAPRMSLPLSSSKYGVSTSTNTVGSLSNNFKPLMECTNLSIIDNVHRAVKDMWGFKQLRLSNFPCSNPKSLMRAEIPRLHNEDYHIGLKTNGVRMFLYMGTHAVQSAHVATPPLSESESESGSEPVNVQVPGVMLLPFSVLIDRAFKMYEVDLDVNPLNDVMYFRGTLFDGELLTSPQLTSLEPPSTSVDFDEIGATHGIQSNATTESGVLDNDKCDFAVHTKSTHMQYILFDAICVGGRHVNNETFSRRLEHVNAAFVLQLSNNLERLRLKNGITASVKTWFRGMPSAAVTSTTMTRSVIQLYTESHVNNTCDGLIFVAENGVLCAGTPQDMFKWKPGSEHTVDFLWDANRHKLFLCGHDHGFVSTSQLNIAVDPNVRFYEPPIPHRTILECTVNWEVEPQVWIATPICIRDDKKKPNNIQIAAWTLKNIHEALTLDDVFSVRPN